MKFVKLREVITRGAVRVVHVVDDKVVKDSFRSMDAVPETFDKCKVQYISGRDDIMLETNKDEEPVATRGIEIRVEKKDSKKNKKNKDNKEKIKLSKELGIDDVIIDPEIGNDPIDKALDTDN